MLQIKQLVSHIYRNHTIKFAIINRGHILLHLADAESSMKNQLRVGMTAAAQKSAIFRRKIHFEDKNTFFFRETNKMRTMTLFCFFFKRKQRTE